MSDIKEIIAKNITALRVANGLTQSDLAQKLNYSDKAVSKWERNESLPDVTVLMAIAEFFDVSLDYLVSDAHTVEEVKKSEGAFSKRTLKNRAFITGIAIIAVWLLGIITFVVLKKVLPASKIVNLTFLYTLIGSFVVWLVLNSVWFNKRKNYLIISFVMWAALSGVILSLFVLGISIFPLYLLGVLGQIIIIFCSRLNY